MKKFLLRPDGKSEIPLDTLDCAVKDKILQKLLNDAFEQTLSEAR